MGCLIYLEPLGLLWFLLMLRGLKEFSRPAVWSLWEGRTKEASRARC